MVRSGEEKNVYRELNEVTETLERELSSLLRGAEGVLATAAQIEAVRSGTPDEASAVLRRIHDRFAYYSNFSRTNSEGQIVASSTPLDEPIDVSDAVNIQTALLDKRVAYSRFVVGPITGEPVIVVSEPVLDSELDVTGVVSLGIRLNWLQGFLEQLRVAPEQELLLLDDTGHVLSTYPRELYQMGDSVGDTALFEAVNEHTQEQFQYQGPDGDAHYVAVSRMEEIPGGLYIVAQLERSVALSAVATYLHRDAIVLGGTLLLTIIVAWGVSKLLLLDWVRRLTKQVGEITEGRFQARIPDAKEHHELGRLALAMNTMASEIQSRDQALEEREARLREARDRLQERVAEQTRTLRETNEQLRQEIREHERARAELVRAKEAAEVASKAKDEFLAIMSHELRTPLNGVMSMLQLIHTTDLSADQEHYVRLALQSGSHLLTIINDILDLSKIEAGKLYLREEPFSLRELTGSMIAVFESEARQKGLAVRYDVDPAAPDHLIGDPGRIRQILFNLLGNAVKFTESGHIRLRIMAGFVSNARGTNAEAVWEDNGRTAHRSEAGRDEESVGITFEVADTGIGIPEDQLEAVFQPFTQLDSFVTRRYAGTGLGLGVVRRLVHLMDGTLEVRSTVNEGSVFRVALPLRSVHERAADNGGAEPGDEKRRQGRSPANSLMAPQSGEDADSRWWAGEAPYQILLVQAAEDESDTLRAMLNGRGHRVTTVYGERDVLRSVQTHPYDCLFLDLRAPNINGIEITRLIRDPASQYYSPEIAVVVLIREATAGDIESYMRCGVDAYFSAIPEAEALEAVIAKTVRRP
jgi:signal transduction histidine kinase/CheY-like chemotaxis protein